MLYFDSALSTRCTTSEPYTVSPLVTVTHLHSFCCNTSSTACLLVTNPVSFNILNRTSSDIKLGRLDATVKSEVKKNAFQLPFVWAMRAEKKVVDKNTAYKY